jgi:hypothetical protein
LYVISGYDKDWAPEEIHDFFDDLREAGNEYAGLMSTDLAAAREKIEQARRDIMEPFFSGSSTGTGRIEMTESHIKTTQEDSDVYVLAAGDIDVGLSVFKAEETASQDYKEETGIYTQSGGALNIFTVGDVNVLESRMMTFQGGDITIWSDTGDINAGLGSKTAITKPRTEIAILGGVLVRKFQPPAVGSGIRTLTFDPDGEAGPEKAPPAGDAYVFAPQGVIDAGEAGIAARNVTLGATEVLNVQNIEVSGLSVGVPMAADSGVGLGALSGAGTLAEAAKMAEESTLGSAKERATKGAEELADTFAPTWLEVQVIGFEEKEGSGEKQER